MLPGTLSDMEVFDKPRSSRLAKLLMADGMLPEIPVSSNAKICKVTGRFTIELGSCPTKAALWPMTKYWSRLQFDKELMNSYGAPPTAEAADCCLEDVRSLPPWSGPCWLLLCRRAVQHHHEPNNEVHVPHFSERIFIYFPCPMD